MHKVAALLISVFLLSSPVFAETGDSAYIRINRIGYTPAEIKNAVCYVRGSVKPERFTIHSGISGEELPYSIAYKELPAAFPFTYILLLSLPDYLPAGTYKVRTGKTESPAFKISETVYTGTADYLLNYLRQQQCGFNPAVNDSCHTMDGFIIYGGQLDSTHIDVTGGWHDASDYLRYVATSATVVYQLALAYRQAPEVFRDAFDAAGREGKNSIPDVLDQVKWGIDWLLKMNPDDSLYFHQIADDRDHRGFRLPNEDTTSYGTKPGRPVYVASGEVQGVFANKNRTTGKASTLAKFSSAFALAADVLKKYYPDIIPLLKRKAITAYKNAVKSPGVQQTAPCRSPYFYEEDSWTDDMMLAATELALMTGEEIYVKDALKLLRREPLTGWMGRDTAGHYQYYPFINCAPFRLAESYFAKNEGLAYMARCIDTVLHRGEAAPAGIGIPFIWCSNNLLSSWLSLFRFYNTVRAGDRGWDYKLNDYREAEPLYRNWLFGMNPWGTSMVTGLPLYADYPEDTHSAYAHFTGKLLKGALVDGPVYNSIYSSLKGVYLKNGDEYSRAQPERFVYHDDYADYATNEPTLDGTASLILYLAQYEHSLTKDGTAHSVMYNKGGIIRGDTTRKVMYLIFSGHEYGEELDTIVSVLNKYDIKGSFFFTGDFYRTAKYAAAISNGVSSGHYFGAHSDTHLLYAPWEKRDSLLLGNKEFIDDLRANYLAMKNAAIQTSSAKFFLPPYEWYNDSISVWAAREGLTLINFTPGTGTNADYTIPSMGNKYRSTNDIFQSLGKYEQKSSSGLNGALLLIHSGTHPERTDKFSLHLQELITTYLNKGYRFGSLYELTGDKNPLTLKTGTTR